MRRATLVLLFAAVMHVGCTTAIRPIIARGIAIEEVGETLRDVRVVLRDGAVYELRGVEVHGDALRGTTPDGRAVTLPASQIRYAWRMENDPDSGLLLLTPLAVIGLRSALYLLLLSALLI